MIGDKLFTRYGQAILPFGPAGKNYSLSDIEAQKLFQKLPAHMIRTTSEFKESPGEWNAVLFTDFIALESLKTRQKNEISRGLNSCKIRRVEACEIAEKFYDSYLKANENYEDQLEVFSSEQFMELHLKSAQFLELIEYWGIFAKDVPIGYCMIYLHDQIEANISSVKIDPAYNSEYPSYALFYKIGEHYLRERNFIQINDGFRSVRRDT